MNINFTLPKINLRTIMRFVAFFLLGTEVGLLAVFLYAGDMRNASTAFSLSTWIALALLFESRAFRLLKEKEELEKFLSMPQVDSEGGEID